MVARAPPRIAPARSCRGPPLLPTIEPTTAPMPANAHVSNTSHTRFIVRLSQSRTPAVCVSPQAAVIQIDIDRRLAAVYSWVPSFQSLLLRPCSRVFSTGPEMTTAEFSNILGRSEKAATSCLTPKERLLCTTILVGNFFGRHGSVRHWSAASSKAGETCCGHRTRRPRAMTCW